MQPETIEKMGEVTALRAEARTIDGQITELRERRRLTDAAIEKIRDELRNGPDAAEVRDLFGLKASRRTKAEAKGKGK